VILGIVIYVQTQYGRLVIETEDENVKILVQSDGGVEIIDPKASRTIKLWPGKYDVRLEEERTGLSLNTDSFTMKRNGQVTIRVRYELADSKSAAVRRGSPDPAAAMTEGLPDVSVSGKQTGRPAVAQVARSGDRPPQEGEQPQQEPVPRLFPAGIVPKPAELPGIGRWNVETARPRGQILSADWSPDGKQIACGMATGHIRIYDAQSLKLVRIIDGAATRIRSVAWSPDGTQLASVGPSGDSTIRIWTNSGSAVGSFPTSGAQKLAWHPSGEYLTAASGGSTGWIDLYRLDGEKQRLDFPGSQTRCLAWNPQGDRLAVAGTDGTVRLWSLDEAEWRVLEVHAGQYIPAVAWHPDGRRLASAVYQKHEIVVLDTEGTVLQTFKTETYSESVAWSSDGTKIIAGDYLSGVYIWPLDGSDAIVLKEHLYLEANAFVSASPNKDLLLTAGSKDGNLRLWTLDGKPAGAILGAPIVLSADCNSHGVIASGNGGNQMRFWQDDGRLTQVIDTHADAVTSVAWHPDGCRIASSDLSGGLHVHRSDGDLAETFPTQNTEHHVWLQWNHTGDRLAGLQGRTDGRFLRIWSTQGEVLRTESVGDAGFALSWSPDDKRIAIAGSNRVGIWDLQDNQVTKIRDGAYAFAVAWHPTAAKLAIGVHKGVILSDDSGIEQTMLENGYGPFTDHGYKVTSLSWQPTAARLLAVDAWGRVALWSADGELLQAVWDHSVYQYHIVSPACCWTHDGEHFLTAAFDGTIRCYRADPVEPLWVALNLPDGKAVTFSAAGEILHGDPKTIDEELVYLIETPTGTTEMLTPTEFQTRVAAQPR